MKKNVAGQFFIVKAITKVSGDAVTGDAANITAQVSKDTATPAATNDVNPTEIDATDCPGWYAFTCTQSETNAEHILIAPASSTQDVIFDDVVYETSDPASSLSGQVLDEPLANHTITGSFGAKLGTWGTPTVTVQNPVGASNDLTIVQGDDYSGARAIVWTITNYAGPSLDTMTATIAFVKYSDWIDGVTTTAHGTDPTSTAVQSGTTVTITQTLTAAQTAAFSTSPPGDTWNYRYGITVNTGSEIVSIVLPNSRCQVLAVGS